MNLNRQRSVALGIALIGLGIVWWLNLWALIWPGALVAAGVLAYTQRRSIGRTVEAVQAGLWFVGLALLFLIHFIFPGILFLAGASVLIRGRETRIDEYIQGVAAQARAPRRPSSRAITSQQVPISTQQVPIYPSSTQTGPSDAATTGQTTRLP